MPNVITGLILALGRVSGETAPILFTCAAYFLPQLPTSILDQCMALPYHLYVISTSGTDMDAQLPLAYGTCSGFNRNHPFGKPSGECFAEAF